MLDLPLVGAVPSYWIGVLGSLMVELFAAAKACGEIDGAVPPRYKRPFYIATRILMALFAGVLAVVFEAPSAFAAFYLGASAPLVMDRLAQGVVPQSPTTPPALS
jgi:hypothetical protein